MCAAASASLPSDSSRRAVSRSMCALSETSGWASRRARASTRWPRAFAGSLRQRSIDAIFRRSRGIRSGRPTASHRWTAWRYSSSAGCKSPRARNASPTTSGRTHIGTASRRAGSIFRRTLSISEAGTESGRPAPRDARNSPNPFKSPASTRWKSPSRRSCISDRIVHDDASRDRRREQVLRLERVDGGLPFRGEAMHRVERHEAAEQRRRLEERAFALGEGPPNLALEVARHFAAHHRTGLRRERQQDGVPPRGVRDALERDLVSCEPFRSQEGQGRVEVETPDPEDFDARTLRGLSPREVRGDRAGDHDDLRPIRLTQLEDRPAEEPREIRVRALEVVEDEEDRQILHVMVQDPHGDGLRVRPALSQQVRQATAAQPREERRELAKERRPRRAVVDLEPVDVRARSLADEPARDERALADPRDPRDDQYGGRRSGPGIEGAGLLGASEDAAEPAEHVPPEDRRDGAGPDPLKLREVEPPPADEGDGGGQVDIRGKDLRNVRHTHRRRIERGRDDLDDVRLQSGPELHRLDPALVAQAVHGLP